jgi:NCAIR mutase (PurE)-related protein
LDKLKHLLEKVKSREITIEEAMEALKNLPYENLGYARIDHHRSLRRGIPEVIFCQKKTIDQVVDIARCMLKNGSNVLGTRARREMFDKVKEIAPNTIYHESARAFTIQQEPPPMNRGIVAVITAGTSDIPVAEEAAVTASFFGNKVEKLYDVGVAGIHRLLSNMDVIKRAQVLIVVAGMEGALASVVAGLVEKPVVAVPTSVGYGANFGGLSALLAMLNSCAGGISVVNIDNGFGAGLVAHQINKLGGVED